MNSERMDGFFMAHLGSEKKTDCEILREKRLVLGLTQKQVAEKAGVAFVTYQRFESGERNIRTASFQLVCRVLRALGMSVDAFLNGDYIIGEGVYSENNELHYTKTGRNINDDVK
ncbi:MAG: helix-turn-helix domain-containing protein [Ruminococcus flavefaciens]|nr:helix-turn-helix domain-containing protein [Ruminococcus flavefaciens]